jgi:tetratricopeptide (TPR) repeat protein
MKKIFLTFGLCISVSVAFGQKKAVADALRLAKDVKPNIEEARKKIKPALENAETKNDAKTWYTAGQIESIVIDGETNKMILGKQPDEAVMYAALENLYPYFSKAYELDILPNEKGKVKPRYVKDMKAILKANLPYYINAGAYFFEKQDFRKVYDFFNAYVEISDSKLLKEGEKEKGKENVEVPVDSSYILANYYAAIASSQIDDHEIAVAAMKRANKQEYKQEEIMQYLAEQYKNVADTVNFEATLEEGLAISSQEEQYSQYFLLNLINIYIQKGRNEKAIEYINKAITTDPDNANLYDVGGKIYETGFKDLEKAEEYFIKAIERDSENAETQSNLGRIYFNQGVNQLDIANSIQDAKKYNEEKAKANDLFKKALPYFEKSFRLNPDVQETKIALRSIYYNLNMGDKLSEIEKIMEN